MCPTVNYESLIYQIFNYFNFRTQIAHTENIDLSIAVYSYASRREHYLFNTFRKVACTSEAC